MSISIDNQFAQFVAFAQKEIDAGKKTSIARLDVDATLGGHTIKRADGDHVGALKRSSLNRASNDQIRWLFTNVVYDLFGGVSKVPKDVFKALEVHNLTKALYAAPNDQTLIRGAQKIVEAIDADAGHLRGSHHLRLGNEVMIDATDLFPPPADR